MEVETDIPDDPQEKINSMLERLEDTREKMEIEARIFIEATKQFTLEWIRREMEVTILTLESEPSPDNLGSDNEKLSELKSDLKELPYRIPDIVEAHLNREDYWIYRRGQLQAGISGDYLEFKKEKMRRELTSSIRMILGCAVEIFGDLNDGKPEDKGWQYFTNWIRKSSSFIPISKYFSVKCLKSLWAVSYTHLRAHETDSYLVCRLLL